MKKILTQMLSGLLLLPALFFVSCEPAGVDMRTEMFTVDTRDWEWNDAYGRYEYVFDFYTLDEDMYWDGSVSAAK